MSRLLVVRWNGGAALFLCSSDASLITGHTLPVDGGQAANWTASGRAFDHLAPRPRRRIHATRDARQH